jgi:hypothetical protein
MHSVIEKPTKSSGRGRISLRSIHEELSSLRERVEDLEDLRELNQAIERNGSKRLNSWVKAKKQLGLT